MYMPKNSDEYDTVSLNTINYLQDIVNDWHRENKSLDNLPKKVRHLHTNLLYFRSSTNKRDIVCRTAWHTLISAFGSHPDLEAWKRLGENLELSKDNLECIGNLADKDPVDIVLKVFAQNDNATLDKVIEALLEMQEFTILQKMVVPLQKLCESFKTDDSGYQSNENGKINVICFKNYSFDDLPKSLNKSYMLGGQKSNDQQISIRRLQTNENKDSNNVFFLFLTYAQDGYETALNIKSYVENWDDMPEVTVIILNENKEEIYENPEKGIREYFEKADFIVPILTTGYLNAIRSSKSSVLSTSENMDFKYVAFIYSLISNYYIHGTGCLNKKVRSVVPSDADLNVVLNISMYPDLLPWTHETQFNEQFKVFLKKFD